jgi:hypothetical protein
LKREKLGLAPLRLPGTPSRHRPADSAWQALERALAAHFFDGLFTILQVERECRQVRRAYSSNPNEYPCGGTKALLGTPWADHVIDEAECFIAAARGDMESAFADHHVLFELGCTTALNVPIRQGADVAWTVNLLRGGAPYTPAECVVVHCAIQRWIENYFHE